MSNVCFAIATLHDVIPVPTSTAVCAFENHSFFTKMTPLTVSKDNGGDVGKPVNQSSHLENKNSEPSSTTPCQNINPSAAMDGEATKSDVNPSIAVAQSKSTQGDATDPRLMRAARFLCHPSMNNVSSSEKESYLQWKGYSDNEISLAKKIYTESAKDERGNFGRIWDSEVEGTRNGTRKENELGRHPNVMNMPISTSQETYTQGYYPHGNAQTSEQPELPNAIIPITIGGLIAMFGMAAFRWLNGGDFVLFPPSANMALPNVSAVGSETQAGNDSEIENSKQGRGMLAEGDESSVEGGHIAGRVEHEKEEYFDNVGFGQQSVEMPHLISQDSTIAQHLQSLSMAIEKQTLLQEQALKVKSDEKARSKTNIAMDLLMKKRSQHLDAAGEDKLDDSSHLQREGSQYAASQISILVQLTEMKCLLKTVANTYTNASDPATHSDEDLLITKLEMIRSSLETIEMNVCRGGSVKDGMPAAIQDIVPCINTKDDELTDKRIEADPLSRDKIETKVIEVAANVAEDEPTSGGTKFDSQGTAVTVDVDDQEQDGKQPYAEKQRPSVGKEALQEALRKMKENNAASLVKTSCQMLCLYMNNLASNPKSDKYSKIYTKNNTFKNKIGSVKFAKDVLISVGFEDEGSCLRWNQTGISASDGIDSSDDDLSSRLQEAAASIQDLQTQLK